jgi:hypothetical protein
LESLDSFGAFESFVFFESFTSFAFGGFGGFGAFGREDARPPGRAPADASNASASRTAAAIPSSELSFFDGVVGSFRERFGGALPLARARFERGVECSFTDEGFDGRLVTVPPEGA